MSITCCGIHPLFARLAQVLGDPEWMQEPDFATATARGQHQDRVDALLEGRFAMIPDLANNSTVAGFPAFSGYSDASARIVRAVGRKRPQVGAAKAPVILAIDGGSNATLGDFDRALFGSFRTSVAPDSDVCIHQFCPSGDFAALREGEPTYAGVLAYEQVGFTCPAEPILYLHPRFTGRLPDELRALATRQLVDRNRIEGLPARNPRILANLRPVDWTLDSDES